MMQRFTKVMATISTTLGPQSVTDLVKMLSLRPVITIGGDQLTGKSTLSKQIAQVFDCALWSTGSSFRAMADKRGISVAEMSRQASLDPAIDVAIDYHVCSLIASGRLLTEKGGTQRVLVVEGRQPSVMASFVQSLAARDRSAKPCFRIYLKCSPIQQALRFVEREFGHEPHALIKRELLRHASPDCYPDLTAVAEKIAELNFENKDAIISTFVDNQTRDQDDLTRFDALYGMDYRDESFYDLVIDTSNIDQKAKLECALAGIQTVWPHMQI